MAQVHEPNPTPDLHASAPQGPEQVLNHPNTISPWESWLSRSRPNLSALFLGLGGFPGGGGAMFWGQGCSPRQRAGGGGASFYRSSTK